MSLPSSPVPPRAPAGVDVAIARRDFGKYLLGHALSWLREARGIPQQSIEELQLLSDATLAEMVPTWREGFHLEVRAEGLFERAADGSDSAKVYSFADHERLIVDQFAGGRNLRTIAEHLAASRGLSFCAAFQTTRRVFVALCERGWCHPAASHCA